MAKGIPDGITREHVLLALRDIDADDKGNFGPSTFYDLIHEGRRYPPKAALGLAAKYLTGRVLEPEDFSGGDLSSCFRILRKLGFTIQPKPDPEEQETGNEWSETEVRAVVKDYFAMLRAETAGEHVNKADHRRRLQPLLNDRSEGSIEFKHRNISGVLCKLGHPYIAGYRPAMNYQGLLAQVVTNFLETDPTCLDIQNSTERVPDVDAGRRGSFASMIVEAPVSAGVRLEEGPRLRQPKKYDFRAKDDANRQLGRKGEELVLQYEEWRLTAVNRADLAREIVWIADKRGDGAGYDIESRNVDGSKIYIEVKTTNCGKDFPFLLSANELNASRVLGKAFWLYRVFDYSREPKIYRVNGDLAEALDLAPAVFESRGIKGERQ